MRTFLYLKFIRVSLLIMLVLLLCSPILADNPAKNKEKKPAIGLIQFSVDILEGKRIVEKRKRKVKNEIIKFLKDAKDSTSERMFQFKDDYYFEADKYIITYSDIEDPDVELDKNYESWANKILKDLSGKHDLGAIIFGHFHEEEDIIKNEKNLIIVFRYYIADDNIPKNQRIVSLPAVKIKTDEITKGNLKKATDGLIKKLKEKLLSKFTQKKVIDYNSEESLSANDVYRMIVYNKFYCEKVDSKFHKEGLKDITVPKDGIFREERIVTVVTDKDNGLIKTKNEKKNKKDEEIVLWWPHNVESHCSFQEAVAYVENLNKNNRDKTKKWRIPTIMELFSIIKQNTENHLPPPFKLPKDKIVYFWTSTSLLKKGTVLDYDKQNKAYFVIQISFVKKGIYSLSFSFRNIEGKNKQRAYLLPVYSDQEYRYKKINKKHYENGKIPGFDDFKGPPVKQKSKLGKQKESTDAQLSSKSSKQTPAVSKSSKSTIVPDKIPGFDDVPDPHQSKIANISSSKKSQKGYKEGNSRTTDELLGAGNKINTSPQKNKKYYPSRRIKIALIPFMHPHYSEEDRSGLVEINYKIKKILQDLNSNMKRNINWSLIIESQKPSRTAHLSNISKFFQLYRNIMNSPTAVGKEIDFEKKKKELAKRVKSEIMQPQKIDIIITVIVEYAEYHGHLVEILKPIIISGIEESSHFKHFLGNLPAFERYIIEKVREIIDKKLAQK